MQLKGLPALVAAHPDEDLSEEIQSAMHSVIEWYRENGYIITVAQVPNTPLAMGNDRDVVTVRRRVPA
jgi:hemolysin activation/secretion protein